MPEGEDAAGSDQVVALSRESLAFVVEVLKQGNLYSALLDFYQRKFVEEMSHSYSKFNRKFKVFGKQYRVFVDIAERLFIPIPPSVVEELQEIGKENS